MDVLSEKEKKEIWNAFVIPMTKPEKIQIVLVLIVLLIGILLDYFLCNTAAFPRSGAVIVCVGIFIGLKFYPSSLSQLEEMFQAVLDGREKLYQVEINALGLLSQPATLTMKSHYDETRSAIRHSISRVKNRILKLEAYTLVAGTLIWGFGDLIEHIRVIQCVAT